MASVRTYSVMWGTWVAQVAEPELLISVQVLISELQDRGPHWALGSVTGMKSGELA